VFLGELIREGIPSLLSNFKVKGEVDFFRSLGSNYLNVEFGWKPLVSDLKKTARALQKQAQILEDLQRNSGRAMRRQYTFPETSTTTLMYQDTSTYPWPGLTLYHWNQAGNFSVTKTDTKKTWFSGEFRYRYPPVTASLAAQLRAKARAILGADLTPETLWNLAPWSWLADWFANIGDVLANISAISEDDLTMRYGYLMQEARREYKHVHTGMTTPYGKLPSTISGSSIFHVKSRIGASPYGFGLTWDSLSPRQLAILAAIGITRRGRK
jgi:hypothetical protein